MSSWVDSGLDAARETAAPPACSSRTSMAVSAVMCRQAAMPSPSKGRSLRNRSCRAVSRDMARSA